MELETCERFHDRSGREIRESTWRKFGADFRLKNSKADSRIKPVGSDFRVLVRNNSYSSLMVRLISYLRVQLKIKYIFNSTKKFQNRSNGIVLNQIKLSITAPLYDLRVLRQ